MAHPVDEGGDGRDEPEECVSQVDPDRVLHALDARVALRVGLDVHLQGGTLVSKLSPPPLSCMNGNH